jgi:hypothetical protein
MLSGLLGLRGRHGCGLTTSAHHKVRLIHLRRREWIEWLVLLLLNTTKLPFILPMLAILEVPATAEVAITTTATIRPWGKSTP